MKQNLHPLAITMWDFSWIERRWDGGSFEDWDSVLTGLRERGYDAVRIDAYPHLLSADKDREWLIRPVWYSNDWGSPYNIEIRLFPALTDFISKCRANGLKVALSSWFREDADDTRMLLSTPESMAKAWTDTLRLIDDARLMDSILYVDLCNEWPGDFWAPYFRNNPSWMTWSCWFTETSLGYMRRAIELVRKAYPDIAYCFSFDGENTENYRSCDLSFFDLAEHHIWMTKLNNSQFYEETGRAKDGRFTEEAYHLLSENALRVYNSKQDYWKKLLVDGINTLAADVRAAGLPLITTECWGITDYKDYPMLPWDWVKDLCELGVQTACATGQWAVMATSNFACPQFKGMWKDIAWHKRLTDKIHSAKLPAELEHSPLMDAMIR